MEESRELVRQAKKGKREAFAKLYETVYEDMYRFALYVLKDREDAEDAVAETVADAFESIGKLRKEEAFRAWIFQILSNKCKRKLKEYITKTYSYEENEQRLEKDSKTEDIAHAIHVEMHFILWKKRNVTWWHFRCLEVIKVGRLQHFYIKIIIQCVHK